MLPKLVFLFPGQSSQSVGLLSSLAEPFPLIREVFEEASLILGYDLWELAQKGPTHILNQTMHTQPILLTAGIALWRLWKSQSKRIPQFLLGHSLGEYTAYTCGNSFVFEDALRLTEKRGQYMQAAIGKQSGAMATIVGLNADRIHNICQNAAHTECVSLANYNTEQHFVISGHSNAVERAMLLAKHEGATLVKKISVSVPAHCLLMKPAATALSNTLEQITCQMPTIPVLNNWNARFAASPQDIKHKLVQQVYQPVRFLESIQYLLQEGVTHFVECGPGRVLCYLIKRIAPDAHIKTVSLSDYNGLQKALAL